MKLTPEAIELIKGRRDLKKKLCESMGWTSANLYAQLSANREDGSLTKLTITRLLAKDLQKPVKELYQ